MLALRDFNGIDLVANPPAPVALKATTAAGFDFLLKILAIEDDTALPSQQVQITVNWNDGQIPAVYGYSATSNGTNTVNVLRSLTMGEHVVQVQTQNLRAPVADQCSVNYQLTVLPRIQFGTPARILFGPILPKDSGFPNAQQWNFDTGVDGEILDSSVKMLLSTAKGERIMLPDYGTNLRLLIFDPIVTSLQEVAQKEVVEALARWEPRVSLQSLSAVRGANASITMTCALLSKLTQQNFTTTVVFTP